MTKVRMHVQWYNNGGKTKTTCIDSSRMIDATDATLIDATVNEFCDVLVKQHNMHRISIAGFVDGYALDYVSADGETVAAVEVMRKF